MKIMRFETKFTNNERFNLGFKDPKTMVRTVFFDRDRGVGESDKPLGPYSTKMMADDTGLLESYLAPFSFHVARRNIYSTLLILSLRMKTFAGVPSRLEPITLHSFLDCCGLF